MASNNESSSSIPQSSSNNAQNTPSKTQPTNSAEQQTNTGDRRQEVLQKPSWRSGTSATSTASRTFGKYKPPPPAPSQLANNMANLSVASPPTANPWRATPQPQQPQQPQQPMRDPRPAQITTPQRQTFSTVTGSSSAGPSRSPFSGPSSTVGGTPAWRRGAPVAKKEPTQEELDAEHARLIAQSPGPVDRKHRQHIADRPVAPSWSLVPGAVVWMPSEILAPGIIVCVRQGHCAGSDLNQTGYNHPAIVLGSHSLRVGTAMRKCVTVAQLRTYSMMPPTEYLRLRDRGQQFQESIPIRCESTGDVLDRLNPLELEAGWLHSQTHVQLQHIYRVPAELLKVFHHGSTLASDVRLDGPSYNRLMGLFGLVPQQRGVPKYLEEPLKTVDNAPPVQGSYDMNQNRRGSGQFGGFGRRDGRSGGVDGDRF